jgi:hypothetical protein
MSENNGCRTFTLDELLIGYIAENQRELEALQKRALTIEAQLNGALAYFARLNRLEGAWKLAPNGRELVQDATAHNMTKSPDEYTAG